MHLLALAWRMTYRDWRAGELHLLLAALIVAVGAVSSVGLLADRMRLALERDGAQLLGADVVLTSDTPVGQAPRIAARDRGLVLADVVQFPSMVLAGADDDQRAQLASIKAVSDGYPLRGAVRLRENPALTEVARSDFSTNSVSQDEAGTRGNEKPNIGIATGAGSTNESGTAGETIAAGQARTTGGHGIPQQVSGLNEASARDQAPTRGDVNLAGDAAGAAADYLAHDIPPKGGVWLDPRLLPLLNVDVGHTITLGDARFVVDNVITMETDRGTNFVNLAPRLMLRLDDLPATGLIAEGSRISYHLLAAGELAAARSFQRWLQDNRAADQRVETLETGRPEMRRTLDRAQQFLSLVAMLAVLIAAVAIALAARRYMMRHLDSVAVMRCLGATQNTITRLMATEFAIVAFVGSAIGGLLGFLGHLALLSALSDFIATELPPPSLMPAVQAFVIGIWLLLGFALPSLAPLRRVPPARVLRRDMGLPVGRALLGYGLGLGGFVLLLLWVAGDVRLGITAAGGFILAFLAIAVVAWVVLVAMTPMRNMRAGSVAWRFALAGLVRRRGATAAQICALSLGIMALLLLGITRTDLIDGWRLAAPADAPNRFLINIQPHQYESVAAYLHEAGLDAQLHPIIRGRLIQINGQSLDSLDFAERRARRFIDRESNISYAAQLPAHNRLVEGTWFEPGAHQISLDDELAEALGVTVGDRLTWDVAGSRVDVTVANLRQPDWDSMSVNFFVVMSPEALQDAPATWLTSFHVPTNHADPLPALVAQHPNLSVFDISAIVSQVQRVLQQVVAAVQGLFVFTLAAGVLVLYAALSATRDERMREAALVRALGATRRQLQRAQWLELGLIGATSGLLAALAATMLAAALANFVFNFPLAPNGWVWVLGIAGGTAAALLGGQAGLRGVLNTPPLRSLREV